MQRVIGTVLFLLFLLAGFAFCRFNAAPQETAQLQTVPAQTPFVAATPMPMATATPQPVAPVVNIELPAEDSEWYIDGWAEDVVVVNMYGREMRFDQAQFRNVQTHAPIVVQCIDPEASRPNRDFTVPVEGRDRFVYKGNQFWHTTDPAVQRFIFIRQGELP